MIQLMAWIDLLLVSPANELAINMEHTPALNIL